MAPNWLLVDVGNSTIEYAGYVNGRLRRTRRIPTESVQRWLATDPFAQWDRVAVSSVVPTVDRLLRRYPMVSLVTHLTIPRLKIAIPNPDQVGSDRIVNALGAFQHLQRPVVIVDSGTATTVCYVDATGTYRGGVIMPGMGISSKALALFTAKIPIIRVSPQARLIGESTKEAVQIGLYRGTIHAINGLIDDLRRQDDQIHVVGTGNGLLPLKAALALDSYDPLLIFKGLAVCADAW